MMKRMCCFLACLLLGAPSASYALKQGPYTYTLSGGNATITGFSQSYSGDLSITNKLDDCPVIAIDSQAFYKCTKLTSVAIPESVINISDRAFYSCSGMTNITVESTNPMFKSMDGVLFGKMLTTLVQYPTGKVGVYTIPTSVTAIGNRAFYACAGLTCITIPASVTTIGEWVFTECSGLISVTISDSVTSIGGYAFQDCTGLTNVTLPNSVTSIGTAAFAYCVSLTSVTIPDSITILEDKMFYKCSGLQSVTIPDSVTSIDGVAFNYCSNLQSIYFSGNPPSISNFSFNGTYATLYYLPAFASIWPSSLADCLTKLWDPVFANTTVSLGHVSLSVTGSPDIPIALEATTNLNSGAWVRLCTTNLTANSIILHDLDAVSHPTRFYRIVGP